MRLEVLVWALLFVVSSGLVFRFIFWLGRRSRAGRSPKIEPHKGKHFDDAKPAIPVQASPPNEMPKTAAAFVAPPPPPVVVQPAPSLAVEAPQTASRPSAPTNVPKPAPARADAAPRSSVEAVSPSHETAQVADTPIKEIGVAAEPPLRTAPKPSIAATLPPPPVATPVVPAVPSSAALSDPVPDVHAAAPDLPKSATPFSAQRTPLNSKRLRAWKIGAVSPTLDIRLKESRNRKVVSVPQKTSRKPPETASAKEMKVLAQRSAPEQKPIRRAGRKVAGRERGAGNILASAPAQTRIVGVPPRGYRVLSANEL